MEATGDPAEPRSVHRQRLAQMWCLGNQGVALWGCRSALSLCSPDALRALLARDLAATVLVTLLPLGGGIPEGRDLAWPSSMSWALYPGEAQLEPKSISTLK